MTLAGARAPVAALPAAVPFPTDDRDGAKEGNVRHGRRRRATKNPASAPYHPRIRQHSEAPPPPAFSYRNSSIMLCSGGRPTHARKKFSSAARCLPSALTTGAPDGTSGAFVR